MQSVAVSLNSVLHTLVTGTCGPIRPSGPNGTSDSIMTKKASKLGIIDHFGQGRIIILIVIIPDLVLIHMYAQDLTFHPSYVSQL